MNRFGKGWNTDVAPKSPKHKVGLGHPEHLLGAASFPSSAEVVLPSPVDQGQTSSCTGNSTAVAICTAMAHSMGLDTGKFPQLPSRLFLYFGARFLGGNVTSDDGAIISDIFAAAAKLGVPPETAWTFSEELAKITSAPDPMAYHLAADQRIVKGAWRITSTGSRRVDDVKRAIAGDDAVVWGTTLDQAFEDLRPEQVWPGVRGPEIGGHAMILFAYRTNVAGRTEFRTRSSWGSNWCDGGSAWISEEAVASSLADDFWIVETVDAFSEVQ